MGFTAKYDTPHSPLWGPLKLTPVQDAIPPPQAQPAKDLRISVFSSLGTKDYVPISRSTDTLAGLPTELHRREKGFSCF